MSQPPQPNAAWGNLDSHCVLWNRTAALTCHEAFKFVVPFLLLLPLRLLCIAVALFNLWLCCRLCILGLSSVDLRQAPLSPGRQLFLVPARWSLRLFLVGLGYWRIRTKGQRSTAARIIVANHLSFVEAAALACSGHSCFVSRKENDAIPVVSTALRAFQCISVDRMDPESRKAAVESIHTRATSPGWPQVIIFPEGTTSNGAGLMAFKLGAFTPLLPVQPCCVSFPYQNFDPSYSFGTSLPGLALRSLAQWYNSLTLDWMEPVPPHAAEDLEQGPGDPKQFCDRVRVLMGGQLAVPLVLESYQDVQLRLEAAKLRVADTTPLVQVERAAQEFGIDLAGLTTLLRRFVMRYGCTCSVNYSVLQHRLALPAGPLLQDLFEALDVDRDGTISFANYVEGCYQLDRELSLSEALLAVTNHFSHSAGHCVSKQDVAAVLQPKLPGLQSQHVVALWKLIAATDPNPPVLNVFGHQHPLTASEVDSEGVVEADSVPVKVFQSFLLDHLEFFFLFHWGIANAVP